MTETYNFINLPRLILSLFSFFNFFKYSNSFSLCYIDLVNLFCVILRAKCICLGLCVSVGMGLENFKFFVTTVLFSAQQDSTHSFSHFLPLGNCFPFLMAVSELHTIQI